MVWTGNRRNIAVGSSHEEERTLPLVSIIVPTYNTPSKPFERCLVSLMSQSYKNIEILLVDDGSDEDYASSISSAALKDSRTRILNSGHRGASHARNLGISEAKGDWIVFSDADDELETTFIERAVYVALKSTAEIVCSNVQSIYLNTKKNLVHKSDAFRLVEGREQIQLLANSILAGLPASEYKGPACFGGPVAKLYKKSLINIIEPFDESLNYSEDRLFNYYYLEKCQRVAFLSDTSYYYYQYASSSTHAGMASWKTSIDKFIELAQDIDSPSACRVHASMLATYAIKAEMGLSGFFAACKPSVRLLKDLSSASCFNSRDFSAFEASRWLKLFLWLIQHGIYGVAYFYWALKEKFNSFRRRQRVIDQQAS